ncbi:hypothetical protein Y032_0573g160 [Ancylostoma ceylanicum]|uniref:Integrase catalytic domain-containing protein n=1 Tax=Ancylostoma ceylanicum TaxID=53326 RepID=A0A016WNU2_9BILA|nr:hypothetical protein Y032_0573g160 [Ancylostoma ceylanicum]
MTALVRMHRAQHMREIEGGSNTKLNQKKDHQGITRCYGRLGNITLTEDAKNSAFIVPNTSLARLIIQEAHGSLHCATAHTMCNVRQEFWIPRLREQVKRMIRKCLPCQRFNNLPYRYPPTKDLPERRVVQGRPFLHVGLGYSGPWKLREDNEETSKAYGCIFTCTTTRLMHLELVRNNSTTAFLNAVRRLIARKGVPKTITCDNAPTFLLGKEILTETAQAFEVDEEVKRYVSDQAIEWRNITPYAPWQGGFFERLIQSIKRSLQKAIGHRTLDVETLTTLLTEVEASLNSPPLTYQESDFKGGLGIRPIDFVQKDIQVTYPLETQPRGQEGIYSIFHQKKNCNSRQEDGRRRR